MKPNWILGFAIFALMLTGCEKLNDQQKSGLQLAAIAAKERAVAFDVIKERLRPVKPAHELALKNFLNVHAAELNSQSTGLHSLVNAVKNGSIISDKSRIELAEEAKTQASRARIWEMTVPDIAPEPALEEFLRSHTAALRAQVETLSQLSKLLPPKPPKVKSESVK